MSNNMLSIIGYANIINWISEIWREMDKNIMSSHLIYVG